mmetsp:Transcript_18303/g.42139  ORF Transcript_18303/g.42139 Transcript_18303/m.42139 type:complete len:201 (+) Transcript_18303:2543-3145(+)
MDLSQDRVLQVINTPLVFELDVQAVFDSHLHFDGLILRGRLAQNLDPDFVFFLNGREKFSFQHNSDKVTDCDVSSSVRLVFRVHVAEEEGEFRRLVEGAGRRQFSRQRDEVVMRPTFVYTETHTHVDAAYELNFDPEVFYLLPGCHLECDNSANILVLLVHKKGIILLKLSSPRHNWGDRRLAIKKAAIRMFDTPKWILL